MDELRELMATYEAELRKVADEHGGQVEVWRPESAEVVHLPAAAQAPEPQDGEDIAGEPGLVIDADFDEIEPGEDDDDTIH